MVGCGSPKACQSDGSIVDPICEKQFLFMSVLRFSVMLLLCACYCLSHLRETHISAGVGSTPSGRMQKRGRRSGVELGKPSLSLSLPFSYPPLKWIGGYFVCFCGLKGKSLLCRIGQRGRVWQLWQDVTCEDATTFVPRTPQSHASYSELRMHSSVSWPFCLG